MNDSGFNDLDQKIVAAVSEARTSFAARQNHIRQADNVTDARRMAANGAAATNRGWAAERMQEVGAAGELGRSLLPHNIASDDVLMAAAIASSIDARDGLSAAVSKAQAAVDGIRNDDHGLAIWRASRAKMVRAALIGLLALLALFALLWVWRLFQNREEHGGVEQIAVPAQINFVQATASSAATRGAEQGTNSVGEEAPAGTLGDSGSPGAPTLTPPPPTRTPRPPPTPGPTPTSLPPGGIVCPGAWPTRLTVGGRAKVINYQLNVRSGPGTHHDIVRRLDPERTVDVLDGPVCDGGQLWYYILSEEIVPRDGSSPYRVEGWLVEESGDTYYLEPLR